MKVKEIERGNKKNLAMLRAERKPEFLPSRKSVYAAIKNSGFEIDFDIDI